MSFPEFLDQAGGFYYEVSSSFFPLPTLGGSLQACKRLIDQQHSVGEMRRCTPSPRGSVHFFGYELPPFTHCPVNEQRWENGRCSCNPASSFDYIGHSCLRRWEDTIYNQ